MDDMYTRIYQRCRELGITPGYICDKLGIRRAIMSELKNSKSGMLSSANVVAVADYLNVSTDWLLTGKEYLAVELPEIGSVSETEKVLIKSWRAASDDERENVAFTLRNHGMYSQLLSDREQKQDVG